jgi:hypothetical protein
LLEKALVAASGRGETKRLISIICSTCGAAHGIGCGKAAV